MDREDYVAWLSQIDELSAAQRAEAGRSLAGQLPFEAVVGLLEERVGMDRRCAHCAAPGAVIRGRSNGLRRYFCRGCGKTFNCLTGTPLARLRHKELWTEFGASLSKGETLAASAERCGVAGSTAFRWRHRFLQAVSGGVVKLRGIVEADETFVLASRKGARKLDRKPRKRGGKASKRGLSDEQIPILVAADRSGSTVSAVLSSVCATYPSDCVDFIVRRLNDDRLPNRSRHIYSPPFKRTKKEHLGGLESRGRSRTLLSRKWKQVS